MGEWHDPFFPDYEKLRRLSRVMSIMFVYDCFESVTAVHNHSVQFYLRVIYVFVFLVMTKLLLSDSLSLLY